jgi:subtilisin family serine protease
LYIINTKQQLWPCRKDSSTTLNGTDHGVDSGTSMAAPHVAGAAALFKAENPDATQLQIMNMILNSSSKPTTACHGGPQGYFSEDEDTLKEPLLFREPPISYTVTINANATTTSTSALGSITKN